MKAFLLIFLAPMVFASEFCESQLLGSYFMSHIQSNLAPASTRSLFMTKLGEGLEPEQWRSLLESSRDELRFALKNMPDSELEGEITFWIHSFKANNEGAHLPGLDPNSDSKRAADLLRQINDDPTEMSRGSQVVKNLETPVRSLPDMAEVLPPEQLANFVEKAADNIYPVELVQEYLRRNNIFN